MSKEDLKSIAEENIDLVKKQAILKLKIDSMINNYESQTSLLKSGLEKIRVKKELIDNLAQIKCNEKIINELKTLTNGQ